MHGHMFSYFMLAIQLTVTAGGHIVNQTICSTELDDNLYDIMMQNGNCTRYIASNDRVNFYNPCDNVFDAEDFVYVPNARRKAIVSLTRIFLELSANLANSLANRPLCLDSSLRAFCVHFYLPCGNSTFRHVPQFLCPDTCHYIEGDLCREVWLNASAMFASLINQTQLPAGLAFPNCDNPGAIISFLNLSADCCSNGGVTIPSNVRVTSTTFTTSIITTSSISSSFPQTQMPTTTSHVVGISVGSTVAVLIVLVCTVICLVVFFLYLRKRKVANFQDAEKYEAGYTNNSFTNPSAGVHNDHALDLPVQSIQTHIEQLSNFLIPKARIQLIEILGQGEFGVVYRGLLLSESKKIPEAVAVKTLKGHSFTSDEVSLIMKESLKMKFFDHANVLNLLGVCVDTGSAPYIIMPLMSHGSLLSYLKKKRHDLTVAEGSDIDFVMSAQKQLLSMCLQVAQGMAYLASQKFVHRDLASRNCMVASTGVIKVADFGLTEDIYQQSYFRQDSSTIQLPIKWMALESLHDKLFSEKSDVWSYGVTSWEVFSLGRMPYPGISPAEVVELLDEGTRLTRPTNRACSDDIYHVMFSCWRENPDDRPSFDELVHTMSNFLKPLADYMDFSDVFCNENAA